MGWFSKTKNLKKPTKYYVASERLNFRTGYTYVDISSYGYPRHEEAQETADRWTSEFQSYFWVMDDAERSAVLAKQKTEVLERVLGVK